MSMEDQYVIIKRGLFYKPDSKGYIGVRDLAGLYSLDEVSTLFPNMDSPNQDGIEFMSLEDAPEFSSACWDDVKLWWREKQLASLRKRADALAEAVEDNWKAQSHWADCWPYDQYDAVMAEKEREASANATRAETQLRAALAAYRNGVE